MEVNDTQFTSAVENMLMAFNVDLNDENFKDTPKRVLKAFKEMLAWQDESKRSKALDEIFTKSFPSTYRGVVAQKSIKTISMCPHHLQPIHYKIDIGYIAKSKALGLSKLARIAEILSSRLVLQETLTQDLADVMYTKLDTAGVMVVVNGVHGCMTNRGVKQDIVTTTSSIKGLFEGDIPLRQEFLSLINQ